MQELRFVAVSEDGRYAVLAVPGRSARFTLPIDERLRAVALGQTSRLAQYEIEVESPLRPKEIQARIRAGETVEEIADAAGIAVERVRWFEGPVLAERAYMADQAQTASVRRHGDSTPGPRLGEIVIQRLKASGADPDDAQWDAKKRGDGNWQVQLTFTSAGRLHMAEWVFDPRRRHVLPADDNAARMSLPGAEPPQPAESHPGEATVTHLAPRLGNASGHGTAGHAAPGHAAPGHAAPGHAAPGHAAPGHGAAGHGQGSWARHERPGPGRPSVAEPAAPTPAQAPAAPAPPLPVTAEPRDGVPRVPAAERKPPRPTAPEKPQQVQAPVSAAADAADDHLPAPGPAGNDHLPAPGPAEAAAAQAGLAASPVSPASPASTEPVGDQAGHQGRKVTRGKRSSVPSWDEIMFGNSRQRD